MAFGVVVGVLAGAAAGIHALEEDGAGVDLTGVNDSETGEHVVPEVEAVSSPAPRPEEEPDLTVESPRVQLTPEPPPGIWDRLAACESTSRWHVNTGNGYYGGVQQDMTFWRRYGGLAFAPRPDLASRGEQIIVAQRGLAVQGWAAWPACSRRLGLR